jgi:2-oxo-3-hexenedioate decarboxylase
MSLAERLDEACRTAKPMAQPTEPFDPYEVQRELIDLRVKRGERLTGVKLGFTSEAKRAQMGVRDVILGRLTDAMAITEGGTVDTARFIHPRVEPEVAYLIGANGTIAAVAPAIEVIDSRYENFRFSLESVIADNTSAAAYVIGPWRPYDPARWNLGVIFEAGTTQVGSTGAILGDPRRALAEAARFTALEEGWILLAGAATTAEPLKPGMFVRAEIQHLGSVSLRSV